MELSIHIQYVQVSESLKSSSVSGSTKATLPLNCFPKYNARKSLCALMSHRSLSVSTIARSYELSLMEMLFAHDRACNGVDG